MSDTSSLTVWNYRGGSAQKVEHQPFTGYVTSCHPPVSFIDISRDLGSNTCTSFFFFYIRLMWFIKAQISTPSLLFEKFGFSVAADHMEMKVQTRGGKKIKIS